MTVSEYIFEFLQKKGCQRVYMVSGSSAMWLTDALQRKPELEAVCCHHEQAAAMAADGYGRVNDVPGACLVTIGPGATNAITGVAQAYLDSSPMFVLSGQANSRLLQYMVETGIRQKACQSLNLEPMVKPITKYFAAVMNPDDIPQIMEDAYFQSMDGRRGPVWIDVPVDIQNRQVSKEAIQAVKPHISAKIEYKKEEIAAVCEWIKEAKKPLVVAGYGVRSAGAVELLRTFCEKNRIPVVTSRGGIDVMPTESELFIGRPGSYGDRASHFAIQEADLLLILGSRLSISTIGYYPQRFGKNARKIMVDIDQKEINKEDVPVDLKILGDTGEFLKQIQDKVEKQDWEEWIRHCNENKEKYPVLQEEYKEQEPLNEYYVTNVLAKQVEDANIIVDTGSVCNVVSQSWIVKENQRYLISGGLSCMGFWATAMGAYQEGKELIAIAGDGSTQMNIQEFATLSYNKIPLKLFVYNNNGYMLIRHNQHNYMDDRFLGVGPDSGVQTPDFCKVASAYGIKSVKIESKDELEEKIKAVLKEKEPVVCEIMCQEFAPIVPRIASRVMPDGSLKAAEFEDLYPFLN